MLQLDILFNHHTNMNTSLGILALIGFLASMFVHSFAMTGINLIETYPSLWLLHMGVFLVFIPLVMVSTKIKK